MLDQCRQISLKLRAELRLDDATRLAIRDQEEAGLDIVFLDGEKAEYPKALAVALPKLRPGGLLLADNVLWGGAVARGESDAASAGLREYTRLIFGSEGLVSTIVPIRDGLAITLKR